MLHDLAAVDVLRKRLGVGYEAAVEALDEAQGDVARALAGLERRRRESLEHLTAEIREGVRRSLTGDTIGVIRWKVMDQVVCEAPVQLAGVVGMIVGVLSVLISNSALETAFAVGPAQGPAGAQPSSSVAEVTNG